MTYETSHYRAAMAEDLTEIINKLDSLSREAG